ncbi:D-beta-hydroxybutyrate dehydrogenase, mitochondrial-like [Diadema setosum]|uniref:D-beta-hydroxybutyrate dehydrogenase, mitochondrial-like n=1 Tax=Diadema setosum TaxID=31175 RepID=UPI003B3B3EE5
MCYLIIFSVISIVIVTALVIRHIRPKRLLSPVGRAVVVTGCDTGFGHAMAKRFDQEGMVVFAGVLYPEKEGAAKLRKEGSQRLHVIPMDVTKDSDVQEAVEYVKKNLPDPKKGLWGVANNAGISCFGQAEWCSVDMFKRIADVNLWGTVRVTNAFTPLVRLAKGRIVNISSVLARQGTAGFAHYSISKHGVEAFTQCLRYELRRFGVRVSIVEPGNFMAATNIYTSDNIDRVRDELWEHMKDEQKEVYGKYFTDMVDIVRFSKTLGSTDCSPVVDCFLDALLNENPRIRYEPKDMYWYLRTLLIAHLPEEISDLLF